VCRRTVLSLLTDPVSFSDPGSPSSTSYRRTTRSKIKMAASMVTAQNFAVGTVSRLSHARRSAVAKVASRPLLSGRSSHSRRAVVPVAASRRSDDTQHSIDGLMPETSSSPTSSGVELTKLDMTAAGLMGPLLMFVGDAAAADGQYGLLEGRSAALVHPIVMAALFGTTLYAGYLGFQWRRVSAPVPSRLPCLLAYSTPT
jgi:hypothetical protein